MATERLFTHPNVDPASVAHALAHAGYDVRGWRPVRTTLLDTFDGRLHGAGLRLEAHQSDGLDLVLIAGDSTTAHAAMPAVPTGAGDLPAGPFRARMAPVLGVRTLLPVVTVTGRRLVARRRDGDGKAVVAVTLHDRLAGAGPLAPAWAATVDELAGYPTEAKQARRQLDSLGLRARKIDLLGAAALAAGIDLRGYVASPTVALDRSEPAPDGIRRVLANLAGTIDANWQGTVDDVDPEFLHDLRVAVRRTRSVLAHGKRVLPTEVRDRFGEEFKWLGQVTGPARDLDVYLIEWEGYVEPLGRATIAALGPVVDHIAAGRAAEHAALATALRSDRYRDTMETWRAWLAAPVTAHKTPRLGPVVAERLSKAHHRLLADGRRIGPTTPVGELHELRKDAKRLRYLMECFGGALPAGPRQAFVTRLKALQDNLGEVQDAEVHAHRLRIISRDLPDAAGLGRAIDQLSGVFERRRLVTRTDFDLCFGAYDGKVTRRAFKALVKVAAR